MDSASISTPSYRIFRDKHGIPQFDPKRGTRALKDALVYNFPTFETELQLMQAALQKFFESEKRGSGSFICELPENNLQASLAVRKSDDIAPLPTANAFLKSWKVALAPQRSRGSSRTPSLTSRATSRSRASSRCSTPSIGQELGGGTMSTWQLCNGETIEKKKRQPYDPVKRRKVAENRGNACDKHRAQKSACDPQSCPQNKLYSRNASQQKMYDTGGGSIGTSLPANASSLDSLNTDFDFSIINDPTWLSMEDSSLLDLHQSMTASSSGSWLDNSLNGGSPEGANSISGMSQSTILSPNMTLERIDSVSSCRGHAQPIEQTSVPATLQTEGVVRPDVEHNRSAMDHGEDPFMGWADKRAIQTTEEYGWVLSHVGQL